MAIEPNWVDMAALATAILVAVVGIITYSFQKKHSQLTGLVQSFKLLNDEEHRDAREKVYELFEQYQENKDVKIFRNKYAEMVRADLDQVGSLVRSGTIQKRGFYEAYGYNAFICWKSLRDHIMDERKRRNFNSYMENFEWLASEASKWWKKKGVDLN